METQLQPARWIIEGQFRLKTPMHIGTGLDRKEDENWIEAIALDWHGKPYIPGASLKGALRALAHRHQCLNNLKRLFGDLENINEETKSVAGQAEFYNSWCVHHTERENKDNDLIPRIAIDRITGTAVDKKLFYTRFVQPETTFNFKIIIQEANEDEIRHLLGLLKLTDTDPKFSLGAGANQTQGKIKWENAITAKYFGKDEASKWFASITQGKSSSWQSYAIKKTLKDIEFEKIIESFEAPLELPLILEFHTPFLVKQDNKKENGEKNNEADARPRRNHEDKVILPASSLRGRLRSQAERILRTLGLSKEVPQGHEVPAYMGDTHDDLISLLFGTAGWKGIIQTEGCVLNIETPEKLPRHEMVAIDRFTGSGKKGAKFNVDYVECPTLEGKILLDVRRLKNAKLSNNENALKPALGLMTLLLRDLTEGDIPFGFGINKGYGQCRENTVLCIKEKKISKWEELLKKIDPAISADIVLKEFRNYLGNLKPVSLPKIEKIDIKTNNDPASPIQSSSGFHNPYHFIPLNKPNPYKDNWPEATSKKLKREIHSHDRYQGFSGRFICQLTTQTPLFIGSDHKPSDNEFKPSDVNPFILGRKHAIPATSLRGMLSSLFESISNSNFRVIHPEKYSIRKSFNDRPLSAMGRVIKINGDIKLQPLTLPTLKQVRNGKGYKIEKEWQQIFNTEFAPLRIYFYKEPNEITDQHYYLETNSIEIKNDSEIIIKPENNPKYPSKKVTNEKTKIKESKPNHSFLIGQENKNESPITQKKDKYTCGWIRSLIDPNRDLPNTVKHYVFLPDTTGKIPPLEIPPIVRNQFNELADQALAGMHLQEGNKLKSLNEILPYTPIGRCRESNLPKKVPKDLSCYTTRLKEGDLVFFDIDKTGKIKEISFSSIWRHGIERGGQFLTATDLLAHHDCNLLPLGMDGRCQKLSPAERLFGVVEYRDSLNKETKPSEQQAFGYTGKVRVGFGIPSQPVRIEEERVTLKELASPKPPSPAFYLRRQKKNCDRYLSKTDLNDEETGLVTLRGRKYYLHAWRAHDNQVIKLNKTGTNFNDGEIKFPWVTHKRMAENPQQAAKDQDKNKYITDRQVSIQPISAGNTFYFEIDFNNLDEKELAQLCATLQPCPTFEHRLGMGKPLGLGAVKIEPLGLYYINRHQRYAKDGLNADRFHVIRQQSLSGVQLPPHLHLEQSTEIQERTDSGFLSKCYSFLSTNSAGPSRFPTIETLIQKGLENTPVDIRLALELFGDPKWIGAPVHYPQLSGYNKRTNLNYQIESEHFAWFVNNDNGKMDSMESISVKVKSDHDGRCGQIKTFSRPVIKKTNSNKNIGLQRSTNAGRPQSKKRGQHQKHKTIKR